MAARKQKKSGEKPAESSAKAAKKLMHVKFWLPFATWVIGAVIVTCLLFIFYNPSPTISVTYFVIVLIGFYIMIRSRNAGKRRTNKG
jgi:membrane protein YdbS with pleckstrin-like domain